MRWLVLALCLAGCAVRVTEIKMDPRPGDCVFAKDAYTPIIETPLRASICLSPDGKTRQTYFDTEPPTLMSAPVQTLGKLTPAIPILPAP